VRRARQVLDEGADIIVARGSEAGGHGDGRSTFPLVPAVADLVAQSGRDVLVGCRQSGKSTTTAALALHTAIYDPGLILLGTAALISTANPGYYQKCCKKSST
jgi:nitronate monooxygenase